MEAITTIDVSGENDSADIELCGKVSDILNRAYPAHLWMVGCDHKAGLIYVELPYGNSVKAFPYGFALHIGKLGGAKTMKKKVQWAGGELLERWGLPRNKAHKDVLSIAGNNKLDSSHAVG